MKLVKILLLTTIIAAVAGISNTSASYGAKDLHLVQHGSTTNWIVKAKVSAHNYKNEYTKKEFPTQEACENFMKTDKQFGADFEEWALEEVKEHDGADGFKIEVFCEEK